MFFVDTIVATIVDSNGEYLPDEARYVNAELLEMGGFHISKYLLC